MSIHVNIYKHVCRHACICVNKYVSEIEREMEGVTLMLACVGRYPVAAASSNATVLDADGYHSSSNIHIQ